MGTNTNGWLRGQLHAFLPGGCLLRAVKDPPPVLPYKSACVEEKRKPKDKGLEKGESGENGKKGHKTASKGFRIFKHDSTFLEYEMNRTDRFLRKSSAGLRNPSMHPKLGSPASTDREVPLSAVPSRTCGTHLSAASQSHGPAPRAGSVPRGRSGGLGTGPCFCLRSLYRARRSGGLICPAAPRAGLGYRRAATGKPRPTRLASQEQEDNY